MTSPSSVGGNSSTDIIGNTITKHLAQHLALLLDVIHSQRWSAFENIVLSSPSVFRMICNTIPNIEEFKGGKTLLHACLRYDPPLEIVAKMIKMFPDRTAALRAQDCTGRTPLHIAAACVADPMVIKLLGSADPTTCTILDEDGRTPLHLACDISFTIQDENDKCHPQQPQQRETRSYDAVRALLSDSLVASLVEDEDGMSALEYAIISDASIEVVTLLQKATMESLQEREQQRLRKKRRLLDEDGDTTSTGIQQQSVGILSA
eukprot:CAMPEP_0202013834 /NCGR_PEP_ID=MMETSP0905-20130828/27392_1 /ASSEMBLY_ACC=CAM_ASM_000554 /TAXON_ID=420261 /ORGANISM="Thalassiosira antarctica, Strain CCMP982" /LENGTH=262 /DNA_ID=CAMNT_0048573527 /DNA_START=187 /DNA_END=975 /DNA_ORIENTATION=-